MTLFVLCFCSVPIHKSHVTFTQKTTNLRMIKCFYISCFILCELLIQLFVSASQGHVFVGCCCFSPQNFSSVFSISTAMRQKEPRECREQSLFELTMIVIFLNPRDSLKSSEFFILKSMGEFVVYFEVKTTKNLRSFCSHPPLNEETQISFESFLFEYFFLIFFSFTPTPKIIYHNCFDINYFFTTKLFTLLFVVYHQINIL